MKKYTLNILFFLILLSGMSFVYKIVNNDFKLTIPNGFPEPYIPEDNQLTKDRVELGRRLFFDVLMSRDSSVSCASCHKPELAFTDGLYKSKGIRGEIVLRNSPTLTNVAYQDSGLLMDAQVPSLEMQILVPVQEHSEFDFNLKLIAERMKQDSSYLKMSVDAYGRAPSPFVITRAIACFERTLISGNSRFDQYKNGNFEALNEEEKAGMELFFNELACSNCHGGFNFTNLTLANNGLYENAYPLDSGRMRITNLEEDRDLFKVPTLRNIEVTGPYMHDGSLETLDDVINHYDNGGQVHPNKSKLLKPLNLSDKEKQQLISFLKSLTDQEFIDPDNYQ
jgi:cytochrome c peroxidase